MPDNIFERFLKNSLLNLFSSPQHPISGSFLFTGQKRITFYSWHFKNCSQNNRNEKKLYFAFDSVIKIGLSNIINGHELSMSFKQTKFWECLGGSGMVLEVLGWSRRVWEVPGRFRRVWRSGMVWDLSWLDLSWLNLSWLDLSCCPDSTCPDLTCPDMTCPYSFLTYHDYTSQELPDIQ